MNAETLALIAQLLQIAETVGFQVRDIVSREQAGKPLTTEELDVYKANADLAHDTIQSWRPST